MRDEDFNFYIKVLELEIEALRSVLSEWDIDLSQFTQWHKAEALAELKNHLVKPRR